MSTHSTQVLLCKRFGVAPVASPDFLKVGIALNVKDGLLPINGLRDKPEGGTTGWYIWAGGEMSDDRDFFVPLHVAHMEKWCPLVIPYLQLPPGWRIQIAPDYEDVWEDPELLQD